MMKNFFFFFFFLTSSHFPLYSSLSSLHLSFSSSPSLLSAAYQHILPLPHCVTCFAGCIGRLGRSREEEEHVSMRCRWRALTLTSHAVAH